MKIAILALQGAFAEHQQILAQLHTESVLIRNLADWQEFMSHSEAGQRGLILPGGESTAMLRIMKDENLLLPLRDAIAGGMPVFGTCAGMILLAKEVEDEERERLATMDVCVRRNAYGRQLGSFHTDDNFDGIGTVPMTFIRAPYITHAAGNVKVLAVVNGNIVAARQDHQLVCSFHPELNEDIRIHEYFLRSVI